MRRTLVFAAAVAALASAGAAAADPPQQFVLPGPVPYPTPVPPLIGTTALQQIYIAPRLHVSSDERVLVGVDGEGRPATVRIRQRLVVHGKGDYQLAIGGPIEDVTAAPGSQSQPGLRTDQLLWAGFSPGRKVLAADVRLRPPPSAHFLPVSASLRREGDRVVLSVFNATATPTDVYTGVARAPEVARLLDQTRRTALAGKRLTGQYVTLYSPSRVLKQASIEAPLHVEGELRVDGSQPVTFARTLGDGRPLSFEVSARGGGTPKLDLRAWPVPVVRELRPPGAATWSAAARRRNIPAAALLERLMETRLRLVRADQYQAFLSDPDPDGRARAVYELRTTAAHAPRPTVSRASSDDGGGTNALVVVLAVAGSVALAGGGLVLWAHS